MSRTNKKIVKRKDGKRNIRSWKGTSRKIRNAEEDEAKRRESNDSIKKRRGMKGEIKGIYLNILYWNNLKNSQLQNEDDGKKRKTNLRDRKRKKRSSTRKTEDLVVAWHNLESWGS